MFDPRVKLCEEDDGMWLPRDSEVPNFDRGFDVMQDVICHCAREM